MVTEKSIDKCDSCGEVAPVKVYPLMYKLEGIEGIKSWHLGSAGAWNITTGILCDSCVLLNSDRLISQEEIVIVKKLERAELEHKPLILSEQETAIFQKLQKRYHLEEAKGENH